MPRPFQQLPFSSLPEKPRVAHPYFESTARTVRVRSAPFGGVNVHVRELGSGPPLLLVHGLMTSSYSYRYVMAPLAKQFRVLVPDLPGAGRSDKPDVAYSPRALTTFLGELVRALGVEGTAVVGNSLGGYLCLRLALAEPGVFSRVVDLHSPAVPDARLHALHAALSVPGVRRALAAFVRRDPERWAHRNVHYADETLKSLEEAREYGAPLATLEGSRAFVRWLGDALDPAGFSETLSALAQRGAPCPLLLVYARRDPLVRPSNGVRLHALLPAVPFVWLDDSSHFCHVDTPQALLAKMSDFLRGSAATG